MLFRSDFVVLQTRHDQSISSLSAHFTSSVYNTFETLLHSKQTQFIQLSHCRAGLSLSILISQKTHLAPAVDLLPVRRDRRSGSAILNC